jgi:hypothetical protein
MTLADAQQQQLLERLRDTARKGGRAMAWLCCPVLTALRRPDAAACPQALRPHHYKQAARAPPVLLPRGCSYATPGAIRSGRLRRLRSPIGESAACAASCLLAGRGGSSRLRLVCVSLVTLAAASWGVVRLGGRRLRACRCSRGRRPSGSDSEARDRRAELPQRHPSGVAGRLTPTRLRRACRLQRPCSLLIVRPNRG